LAQVLVYQAAAEPHELQRFRARFHAAAAQYVVLAGLLRHLRE